MTHAKASIKNGPQAFARLARSWADRPWVQLVVCVVLPALFVVVLYQVKSHNFRAVAWSAAPVTSVDGVRWALETAHLDAAGRYVITGWAVQTRGDPTWLKTQVVLANPGQYHGVQIKTNLVRRVDVSRLFADGRDNHHSGFRAQVRARDLKAMANPRVMLSIEQAGQISLIDTGATLQTGVRP